MSEVRNPVAEVQPPGAEPALQPSAGEMLRQVREAAGLHIAALAVSLNVPVKKLEALESDRLDLLPDVVFVRALAASVCRVLKVEAEPILARLPPTSVPRLKTDSQGINTPFRSPADGRGMAIRAQLARPVVLTVLTLVLGALVLLFLPAMESPPAVTPAAPPAPVLALPVEAPALPSEAAALASSAPLPAEVSPPPVLGEMSAALLVFKGRGSSWIEVTDARGVVQLRKTLLAGETAAAAGAVPLSVVVGRANAIEVQLRGKPFDLLSVARENVARFEVK